MKKDKTLFVGSAVAVCRRRGAIVGGVIQGVHTGKEE